MPRKVSAQHREALLDAALECFSKRGFDATRVEDIARLAGVAKGSVYTHFKDKEALFQGLIESTLLPLYQQAQELQKDKTLTLREKITRAAQPLLDDNGNSKSARVMRLFWSESLHNPAFVNTFYREFVDGVLAFGAQMLIDPSDRDIPETLREHPELLFAGLVQGLLWQGVFADSCALDLQAHWQAHLDLLLGKDEP